ncbi:MAG: ring-hydroxylating dioxygenase subunit beta [Burkholderia sp.]|jgi:3-phenylpropionate/cinnamic acid dioxygenase small subunit|nr:ring-hydroxylating dioxygenase subunit beta [Burkholderia sp.]
MKLTGFESAAIDPAAARELRFAVEEFNAEYCAVLDSGEIEQWPDFFTEDAIYRITARENADAGMLVGLVYAEGRGMLQDRAVSIARTQMFAPRTNLHLTGNVRVLAQKDDGEFSAQSTFMLLQTLVDGVTTLHLAGRYFDRFVRQGNRLLLRERQAVYDTTMIATDLVYPV